MENPSLSLAVQRKDEWLRTHGNYAFGLNGLNARLCLYKLDDERIPFDWESIDIEDAEDHARAIHALLDRHP